MRTIAFVPQKGGCGKSTLAACLAVVAQEAGERVFVFNMGPKKSVVRWGSKRNDPHLPVEAVSAARLPQHEPCRCRYSGLGVAKIARRDKTAGLCIVPARPATFDICASEVTGAN